MAKNGVAFSSLGITKFVLFIVFVFGFGRLPAQLNGNVKMGVEAGVILTAANPNNLSLLFNIEPKVKVVNNTFIGLRFGMALNSGRFESNDVFQYIIDEEFDHGVIVFMPTLDHYLGAFNHNDRLFRPFIGLGIGYHLSSDIDASRAVIINPVEDTFDASINERIGFLLRTGLESGHLRLGLEYSLLPQGELKIPGDEIIGSASNSYLGVTVGLMIGGGNGRSE